MNSTTARRATGLAGLAGALLFFAGDMLFAGYIGSGSGFADGMLAVVRHASYARLVWGGLLGPPAACLCIIGFWHVHLNVRDKSAVLARTILVAFCVFMVAGSAVHTLWAAKGLAVKFCDGHDPACTNVVRALQSYWTLAYNICSAPGYVAALLLGFVVLTGRTDYPRWTIVANPAVLIALSPLASNIPSPIGAIIVGGSANLSIAAFFLVSTATTWGRDSG